MTEPTGQKPTVDDAFLDVMTEIANHLTEAATGVHRAIALLPEDDAMFEAERRSGAALLAALAPVRDALTAMISPASERIARDLKVLPIDVLRMLRDRRDRQK